MAPGSFPPREGVGGSGRTRPRRRSWFTSAADRSTALRTERSIGVLRVLLATFGLLLSWNAPLPADTVPALTRTFMVAYAACALGLLVDLHRVDRLARQFPLAVHAGDVCMAGGIALFSGGVDIAPGVFLIFPLLAAAFRWSSNEVLVTTLVLDAVLVTQLVLVALGHEGSLVQNAELDTLVMAAISTPLFGVMIGYLAKNEQQRRLEAIDVGTVLRTARVSGEFDQTISLVLGSLVNTFGAGTALLVLSDGRTGRLFRWRTDSAAEGSVTNPQVEVGAELRGDYFFDLPGVGCNVARRRFALGRRPHRVTGFDASGRRVPAAEKCPVPERFLRRHPCDGFVCMVLPVDDVWAGRVFLLDPTRRVAREQTARLSLQIAGELGPATRDLYRVHHLRTRSQAIERNRIARELHDGVTQSLLGVEMLIAVLRRRTLQEAPALDQHLHHIHDIVREDIVALREITESRRAGDTVSGDLVVDLEELVDRFARHSGLPARFVSSGGSVPLALHIHREVARIVYEGLVNVRKHSGARRVLVRSAIKTESWSVSIEDDGHGFAFAGLKAQAELDRLRIGPRTICERARMIGARVNVESRPGSGSRVEIAMRLPSPT